MSKHALERGRAAEEALKGDVLAYCRDNFNYDPLTGLFVRIKDAKFAQQSKAGTIAGSPSRQGYINVSISIGGISKLYRAHRLAWLVSYGEWPADQIDHINRVRSDNRLANLREADQSTNVRNTGQRSNNNSGHKGVHLFRNRWCARIGIGGKYHHLGYFTDISDAVAMRRWAEICFLRPSF